MILCSCNVITDTQVQKACEQMSSEGIAITTKALYEKIIGRTYGKKMGDCTLCAQLISIKIRDILGTLDVNIMEDAV